MATRSWDLWCRWRGSNSQYAFSTPVLQTGVHSTLDITCMEEGGVIETLRHH